MPRPNKNRPGNLPTPSTTESSGESSAPLVTVISARYRAAWPQLRPRPLEWSQSKLPALVEKRRGEIEWTAGKILHEKNIIIRDDEDDETEAAEVWLVQQEMAGQPSTSVPTIAICASWSEDQQHIWESAVQEIAVELYKMFKDSEFSYENFHIDMQAPELTQTIYYGPVDRDDLSRSWDNARALVHQRLESYKATASFMTSICLFRYGTLSDIDANPATIYIALNYASPETGWPEVIKDIEANIRNRGWTDVGVHFEHNVGMESAFIMSGLKGDPNQIRAEGFNTNKRIYGDYQQIVKPGDDLGPANYIIRRDNVEKTSGLGTLGCFVELKTKSNPTWKKYALTNYHVIRPALAGFCLEVVGGKSKVGPPQTGSDCFQVDLNGYYPQAKQQPKQLESPSRAKHIFTIWSLDDEIAMWTKDAQELAKQIQTTNNATEKTVAQAKIMEIERDIRLAEEEKRKKKEFFDADRHILGTLFAASGYQRRATVGSYKMRLDWALIDVAQNRQGPNILPQQSVWSKHFPIKQAHPRATYGQLLRDPTQSIGPGNSSHVWKVGATTGPTIGQFHKLKINCTMAEDKHLQRLIKDYATTEFIYQPALINGVGTKFCATGDSGSVVFDADGGVVGLFFRGSRVQKSFDGGYGMVTPIEHVFDDIRKFSKGAITEIRIARN